MRWACSIIIDIFIHKNGDKSISDEPKSSTRPVESSIQLKYIEKKMNAPRMHHKTFKWLLLSLETFLAIESVEEENHHRFATKRTTHRSLKKPSSKSPAACKRYIVAGHSFSIILHRIFDVDLLLRFKMTFLHKTTLYNVRVPSARTMAQRRRYWCSIALFISSLFRQMENGQTKSVEKCEKKHPKCNGKIPLKITVHSGRIVSSVKFTLFEVFFIQSLFLRLRLTSSCTDSDTHHHIICEYCSDGDAGVLFAPQNKCS